MLDNKWTTTAMYSQSEIDYCIQAYERQLKRVMSYHYNIVVLSPMYIYNKIIDLNTKIDNLKLLKNAVMSSLNLLKKEHKEVIKSIYLHGKNKEDIIKEQRLSESKYKYYKRAGVKKMSFLLAMMGLTNERFINLYNDEPLVVRWFEVCLKLNKKTSHLRREDCARL